MNFFSKNINIQIVKDFQDKKGIKVILEFILGCFLVALAYNIFIAPNGFVQGGVGGLAVIINKIFGLDNATIILVVNIFLLLLSCIFLEKEKTRSTIAGTILVPILINLTKNFNVWVQMDTSKLLLSVIMGGILYGVGLGLIYKGGFTVGGTDILNQICCKYLKIPMAKSMLLIDGSIVLSSGIIFGLYSMLYSLLILYIISMIADRILLGSSMNKKFYIISEKDEEIKSYIINDLKHGITIFKGKGGLNQKSKNIIMTVLPTKDFYELKKNILEIDQEAFFIITDAYELFGGD